MSVVVELFSGLLIACSLGAPALAEDGRASPAQLQERVRAWLEPRVGEKRHEGQYMRQDCHDADLTQLPDWKGLPVQVCSYTDTQFDEDHVTTTVYLLFPTAEQLASWVVSACVDAGRKNLTTCTGRLTSRLWYASNAQFPVAGYVVEPAQGDWKYPNDPYCLLFRDGVTVTTDSYPDTTHAINNACGPAKAAFEPAVKAFQYGRPTSVTREAYSEAGGAGDVGSVAASSPQFATEVGRTFRDAWSQKKNLLFLAAVAELNACDGNVWTGTPPKQPGCAGAGK